MSIKFANTVRQKGAGLESEEEETLRDEITRYGKGGG